jgi:hypothetical protein
VTFSENEVWNFLRDRDQIDGAPICFKAIVNIVNLLYQPDTYRHIWDVIHHLRTFANRLTLFLAFRKKWV